MHRFVAACSIVIGATTLACSSPPGENVESTSSAQSACEGGARVVTLTGFDSDALVLTGITPEGETLAIRYTADTEALAANLIEYPPDPCLGQATAWNKQIDRGLTQAVIERLAHFASFSCSASVTLGAGNVALTFQPVAFAPAP